MLIINQQEQNTTLERTAAYATGEIKCILLVKIFSLDYVVVKTQKIFSSHGGFQTTAMYHHRETI